MDGSSPERKDSEVWRPQGVGKWMLPKLHGVASKECAGAEVAEVMGISVSTVEKHMIRAMKELREALSS